MCGIFGSVCPLQSNIRMQQFENAVELLRHRGPDDSGIESYICGSSTITLGHTRLSIIDLSPAGHQPMSSIDQRYSIVFNGEIYNYREIRDKLIALGNIFITKTDTEVLLLAWKQWGPECLKQLVGMFAFVVLDHKLSTLTCVRDAFGIKPLYYGTEGKRFLFASEISVIKALKQEVIELNWQRSYDYLVHGDYDSNSNTFLSGISHLLPGHYMQVDLNTFSVSEPEQWWTPRISQSKDIAFNDAAVLLREKFLYNIRLHLRSDVPLGAALSGGIDSSAVVCAIRAVEPDIPIHTFSYIAEASQFSEEKWVDEINKHVNAHPHKVVVSPQELIRDLDEMIQLQGEPFGSTSIYAQYRVFKLASENGVRVTLDGQGADEMLAGYHGYPGQRIRSLIEKGQISEALHFLNEWSRWPGRDKLYGIKHAIAEFSQGNLYYLLRQLSGSKDFPSWINKSILKSKGIISYSPRHTFQTNASGRRLSAELAVSLTRRGLPALLRHGDRNSMYFSVESRVPFLTLDMVDLLLSLPEEYLISSQGETKSVLRSAMRGIVPDSILDRRDKIGFSTPEQEWLFNISDTVRGWLREDLCLPFLNQDQLLKTFDDIILGRKKFSFQVWRWINFSRWYATNFS